MALRRKKRRRDEARKTEPTKKRSVPKKLSAKKPALAVQKSRPVYITNVVEQPKREPRLSGVITQLLADTERLREKGRARLAALPKTSPIVEHNGLDQGVSPSRVMGKRTNKKLSQEFRRVDQGVSPSRISPQKGPQKKPEPEHVKSEKPRDGATCKDRPQDNKKRAGGGSKRKINFIPWCDGRKR